MEDRFSVTTGTGKQIIREIQALSKFKRKDYRNSQTSWRGKERLYKRSKISRKRKRTTRQ